MKHPSTWCVLLVLAALRLHAETVSIDANANKRPIDPRIYGVAFADTASLTDLNAPLNRSGGNTTTRYNWQQNCSTTLPIGTSKVSLMAARRRALRGDSFVTTRKNGGAHRCSRSRCSAGSRSSGRGARGWQVSRSPSTARSRATTRSGFPTRATVFTPTERTSPETISTMPMSLPIRLSSRAGCSTC